MGRFTVVKTIHVVILSGLKPLSFALTKVFMTQDIARYTDPFPGPLGSPVYYRTYSEPQVIDGRVHMQTWEENARRNATFLGKLGELTPQQVESIYEMQCELIVTPPGRVLWAAKEEWVNRPGKANYLGLFNCVGIQPSTWEMFGHNFLLLMMGCGVGSVLSEHVIAKLPPINAVLPTVTITHLPGEHADRPEETTYSAPVHCKDLYGTPFTIYVGDSKEGWVDSYVTLLKLCSDPFMQAITHVNIDLGHVRPNNSTIKGFGGTANPVALASLYGRVMEVFGGACGRQITAYEACLLLNWAAVTVVAGNIRRSARWDGYDHTDTTMVGAKDNLWSQGDDGTWAIDPKKDALRMSNLSAIMHVKPTLDECMASIQRQYDTGEGALYYAPAALVRCNVDLLRTVDERKAFEHAYITLGKETGKAYLRSKMYTVNDSLDDSSVEYELDHRMSRYGANPCFAAGTMVLTKAGHYPIESLVGKPDVEVWDGEQWVSTEFKVTGTDLAVYEVVLEDGSSITATGYHEFILSDGQIVQLLDLMPGDTLMEHNGVPKGGLSSLPYTGSGYLKGFLLGDGTTSQGGPLLHLYPLKEMCKDRLVEACNNYHTDLVVPKPGTFTSPLQGSWPTPLLGSRSHAAPPQGSWPTALTKVGWRDSQKGWWMQGLSRHKALLPWVTTYRQGLPSECYNWSLEDKCEFIAGYFDADGTAIDTKQAYGYQATSVSLELLLSLQLLLKTMGINSHVDRKGRGAGLRDFNDGYGEYKVYRLSLSRRRSIALSKLVTFTRLKSFSDRTLKVPNSKFKNPNTVTAVYSPSIADKVYCCTVPTNNRFALSNSVLSRNCAEVLGKDFVCSLSQVDLSRFDVTSPTLWGDINEALDTASIIVCSLLKRGFDIPELQVSREMDPIVAVTLNGVFDFMVNLWGDSWLKWWMVGCPEWWTDSDHTTEAGNNTYGVDGSDLLWDSQRYIHITKYFLESFRDRVRDTVTTYCTEHKLPIPNRYTAMQPSGSKSCLTGGTPACYTPKASHWIRRITLRRDHPVALASIDYGYKVSTTCKDSNGVLLDDPYDDRVNEWLIEIPDKCTWSDQVTGTYDVANAPITSQWYLTMACQKYFVTHNTSSTLEINKDEVGALANLIYHEIESGGDYVSSAVFARDYQTMPRMPYEPITKEQYNVLMGEVLERRTDSTDYKTLVEKYYGADMRAELGPTVGCDGDSCTLPTM